MREFLEDRRKVRSGNASVLLKAIRQEIADIREEPDWDEYEREYQPMSFNRLKTYLQALLLAGHADEAIPLGKELINAVIFALETYDMDGDIFDEASACMEIVVRALPASSLSSSEQLIWAVDMDLADEYEFCYDVLENIWNNAKKKSDWHALADELQKRLSAIRPNNDLRRRVTAWLIPALEQTGREDEIIPLREREAEITGEYTQLIDLLIDEKHYEDAETWCQKAIANTNPNHPGTISNLEDRLRTIREKTGDHLSATAFYANDFFSHILHCIPFKNCARQHKRPKWDQQSKPGHATLWNLDTYREQRAESEKGNPMTNGLCQRRNLKKTLTLQKAP